MAAFRRKYTADTGTHLIGEIWVSAAPFLPIWSTPYELPYIPYLPYALDTLLRVFSCYFG